VTGNPRDGGDPCCHHGRRASIRMNDDAVRLLGMLDGMADTEPPGGLAAGLQERLASGIVRRAHVLMWADSPGNADGAPSFFPDLTGWECADSSFHLEDEVPAAVTLTEESEPRISEDGQRLLLLHGIVFALGFAPARLRARPAWPGPVPRRGEPDQRDIPVPPDTAWRALECCRSGSIPPREGHRDRH
jgi:hypothetical protein